LQIPDRDAVRIEPSGHDIPVQAGESPRAAALRLGHVTPAVQQERDRLRERGRDYPEVRLACQLEIRGYNAVFKLRKDT
jgi:hypothetical protein